MVRIKTHVLAAAMLLASTACNKDFAPESGGIIVIDAGIRAGTKVSYEGDATEFSAGDRIAVYAWTGGADAVPSNRVVDGVGNTLGTDGKWTPESRMFWYDETTPHFFLGIFPVPDAVADFTADPYTLDPSPAAYTASDLLVATNFGTAGAGRKVTDGAVPLNFDHVLAKLNVNLKFNSQWATTPAVSSVSVTARKTATVNYLTKTVTATATETPAPVDIPAAASAATGYALSYSGLQVPQGDVTDVTVTIAGKHYVYESASDIPLIAGQYTTLGLVVELDKIVLGSISVTDWDTESFSDTEPVLTTVVDGHEFVNMGDGIKWATCNVGAANPWERGFSYGWGEKIQTTAYHYDEHFNPHPTGPDDLIITTPPDWSNYSFNPSHDGASFTKYTGSDYTALQAGDDVATATWGSHWRIPTRDEWATLRDPSKYLWKLKWINGVPGLEVIRLSGYCAGNAIFLPWTDEFNVIVIPRKSGNYWSSSLDRNNPCKAWSMLFNFTETEEDGDIYLEVSSLERCHGLFIRPVTD